MQIYKEIFKVNFFKLLNIFNNTKLNAMENISFMLKIITILGWYIFLVEEFVSQNFKKKIMYLYLPVIM